MNSGKPQGSGARVCHDNGTDLPYWNFVSEDLFKLRFPRLIIHCPGNDNHPFILVTVIDIQDAFHSLMVGFPDSADLAQDINLSLVHF